VGEEKKVLAPGFLPALKKEVAALTRKYGQDATHLNAVTGSTLLADKTPIAKAAYPAKTLAFKPLERDWTYGFEDIRPRYEGKPKDGLMYGRGFVAAKKAGPGKLEIGADGPFKVFVNGKEMGCNPKATNPIDANMMKLAVNWKKGKNEVVIALRTNNGGAWGFHAKVQA
jgi:hypothetical protein